MEKIIKKPQLLTRQEWDKFHWLWWDKDEHGFAWIESAELFDSPKEAMQAFNKKYWDNAYLDSIF